MIAVGILSHNIGDDQQKAFVFESKIKNQQAMPKQTVQQIN